MADSRYDNIRVFYNGNFIIPQQIKVYNGSSWVDLGTKTSYSLKKLNVMYNNNFICATYYRHDVNIPKTIQIGSGSKCADIWKSNGTYCSVDTWTSGYVWEMIVEAYANTPLYTVYAKNQGDITNQAYTNYYAEVSGNSCRLHIKTRFHGTRVSDRKYVDSTSERYTDYCWTVGEKVRIRISKSSTGTTDRVQIYNMNGTELCNQTFSDSVMQVYTPNMHRIGSETSNDNGSQAQYGNAKVYSLTFTPNRSSTFTVDANSVASGSTRINATGGYDGFIALNNTTVYGASYAEYIRQTV